MKKNTVILLLMGGTVLVSAYVLYRRHKSGGVPGYSNFVYLGSPYTPTEGGSRGEVSEECLQHPGYRMCMLTDGTAGVCGTSGMCVTDMEMDIKRNWSTRDDIKMPLCSQPIFKEGCQRFCRCKQLKGDILDLPDGSAMDGCIMGCRSMFYPA